jgi:hypothetical protein
MTTANTIGDAHYNHVKSEGFTEDEIQLMTDLWRVRSIGTKEVAKSSAGIYLPITDGFGQIRCDRSVIDTDVIPL